MTHPSGEEEKGLSAPPPPVERPDFEHVLKHSDDTFALRASRYALSLESRIERMERGIRYWEGRWEKAETALASLQSRYEGMERWRERVRDAGYKFLTETATSNCDLCEVAYEPGEGFEHTEGCLIGKLEDALDADPLKLLSAPAPQTETGKG